MAMSSAAMPMTKRRKPVGGKARLMSRLFPGSVHRPLVRFIQVCHRLDQLFHSSGWEAKTMEWAYYQQYNQFDTAGTSFDLVLPSGMHWDARR
jgi:hypothetical protein